MNEIKLDNSKTSLFRSCRRKFLLSEVLGYKSNFGSTALRYGSTWHAMLEGYYKHILENGWDDSPKAIAAGVELGKKKWDKESEGKIFVDDYKTFDNCCDCFLRYLSFFADDQSFVKIIGTEKKFECPIIPESAEEEAKLKLLPPIIFTGRMDLQLTMSDANWICDFKTTGANLDTQAYRLNRSGQMMGYTYAAKRVLEYPSDGCIVSIAYVYSKKSEKTGEYGKLSSDFRRVPMIFTPYDLIEWKRSFITTCTDIVKCTEENNFGMDSEFVVDFDSCYQYGTCSYCRLCEQNRPVDELNFEGYHIDFWDVLEEE